MPTVIEIALLVVLAVGVGRLSNYHSAPEKPGAVDIGFSQDMAVHHEQAVLMASLAQTRGSRAVASLANAILIDQSQEIGLMRGWLQLWREPTVDPTPISWMLHPGGMTMVLPAMTSMPGMATPDQLTRLSGLSGKRFDVRFLQLMIRHHEGGLQICRFAQSEARLAVVRKAATAMALEQIEDLGQLRAMLESDGGKPLPFR